MFSSLLSSSGLTVLDDFLLFVYDAVRHVHQTVEFDIGGGDFALHFFDFRR